MVEYVRRYAKYVAEILERLDPTAVERIAEIFEAARREQRTIFLAGNGGSAATASHFANDLSFGARVDGELPFRALSLTDNTAVLTALGNDKGYQEIFVGQLRGVFRPGDVLVAISASGNSPNLLEALKYANSVGGITVGLVGFDGGQMKDLCHVCLHVETPVGEYGPVETVHLFLDHLLTDYLRTWMLRRSGGT
jgi:D-sedoheptulose 7-phosphate isomerase